MKNIIALFLTLVFCFFTMSCNNEPIENNEISATESGTKSYGETSLSAALENETIISQESNVFEEISFDSDEWGGELLPRKYRSRYYSVAYPFAELVGVDNYWNWADAHNTENPDDTNEMVIKKFVQYFDITREDFDKANLAFGKILAEGVDISLCLNPKDYADQEIYEIYNADIIYTFDDDIINEYYLSPDYAFGWKIEYLSALESGTYETQTTDWIDIKQMEADIIAKYGEAEIVTDAVEETASAAEESTETAA